MLEILTAQHSLHYLGVKDPDCQAAGVWVSRSLIRKASGHLLFSLRVLGPGQHSKDKSRRNTSGKHVLGFDTERLFTMT